MSGIEWIKTAEGVSVIDDCCRCNGDRRVIEAALMVAFHAGQLDESVRLIERLTTIREA